LADAGTATLNRHLSSGDGRRILLASNADFTFEKIDLVPNSAWCLEAKPRDMASRISGGVPAPSSSTLGEGDAVFAQSIAVNIASAKPAGRVFLAYTGAVGSGVLRASGIGKNSMSPHSSGSPSSQ